MHAGEQPEREFQYLACDVLYKVKPALTPADIPNLRQIVVTTSWWDTVDCLDGVIGDIALRYPAVSEILLNWSTDANIWLRRIAIDHQLLWKDKTDPILLE